MGFTKDIIGTNESVGGINLFEKVQSTQPATPYTAGLMSATDKSKLDSLENYVHPDSGVRPGKYMQVEVNEQGHVTAGRSLQEGTLEDYGIIDAYIDLSDNSIVLGSHRIKPITPSDKVRWDQIINNPDTLAAYGIKDAEISDTGIIRLGEMTIKPLTAESTLSTAKLEGIIDKANLPDTLQELGLIDVAIDNGTINIGGDLITPLTADSQLAADKITGVIDLKNIPVGAMERCVVVEDDTARFALTTNDVQKGDTVKVINPTPTMYMVVDENKLDSADGYVVYSAGNANSVPWSGITDKPDHYYELPPADINTLGGVIVGDNITVDTEGKISTHPPYVLPQATNSTLGGVKIGENLSMQSDGTLSVPNATSTTAGVVKAGNNINIGADGTISGIAYNLPVATSSDLGGVKIGKNVETLGDGTLSVPVATNTKAGVVKAGTNINIADDGTISTEKYQLPTATNMRLGGVRIGKYLSVDSEGLLNATGVPITASKTDLGGVIIGENIDIDENGKISVTLPTKTSELENDSEFITTENLSLLVNVYNNVAEMKQSTRLKAGMAAKTLGYYSANDGGGAYYVIRAKQDSDVDDGGSIHELANGLIAELLDEGYPRIKENYSETIDEDVFRFKSHYEALNEWNERKALDEAEGTFTVATFNVLVETSWAKHGFITNDILARQHTIILMTKAQIIGINEVVHGKVHPFFETMNPSIYTDYSQYINNTDIDFYRYERTNNGEGIMSCYTATSKSSYQYENSGGSIYEKQGYAQMTLNIHGKSVSVYSVHFDYTGTYIQEQVNKMYEILSADTADAKIMMGDFNFYSSTTYGKTVLSSFLADGYKLVNDGKYNSFKNTAPIDEILVSENIQILESGYIDILKTKIISSMNFWGNYPISDHAPVFARLKVV